MVDHQSNVYTISGTERGVVKELRRSFCLLGERRFVKRGSLIESVVGKM